MSNIAIIPARSGSKGLKDKNIKELVGKPLMAYTINAAKESEIFDCVHVSTDSEKYAEVARQYRADVPFLRNKFLAGDSVSTWDVVSAVIEEYKKINQTFDMITVLQPTSPLRTKEHIKEAVELFYKKEADVVVSVCEMEHSPIWSNTIDETLSMKNFIKEEYIGKNRQQLPIYYRINGAMYIWKTEKLYLKDRLYSSNCYAYIMEKKESIDIDDIYDFYMAEMMMKELNILMR